MVLKLAILSITHQLTRTTSCLSFLSVRLFSPTRRISTRQETVSLRVGGNGFVDLRITRPSQTSKRDSKDILVHIPPGYTRHDSVAPGPVSRWLKTKELSKYIPDATIIDVNYRLTIRSKDGSPETDHRFPTPIHDISTAWDYITEEIARQIAVSNNKHGERDNIHNKPKISLVGSHIGGALALTLALTHPNAVHAVAVVDPLVDWTGLDELAALANKKIANKTGTKTKRGRQRERLAAAAAGLITLRTGLFRTPSGYFDEFASPMLFLRAPGRDTPLNKTAAVDVGNEEYTVDGVKMRYGEEEDEVGVVEAEVLHDLDKGYGPYSGDCHAVETRNLSEEYYYGKGDTEKDEKGVDAEGSDSGYESDRSELVNATRCEEKRRARVEPPRRRKVLRRWPSTRQPEETTLPFVNIFLSGETAETTYSRENGRDSKSEAETGNGNRLEISPVTRLQGIEMAELLRRACFWGREKSYAEERVVLTDLSPVTETSNAFLHDGQRGVISVLQWVQAKFGDDHIPVSQRVETEKDENDPRCY